MTTNPKVQWGLVCLVVLGLSLLWCRSGQTASHGPCDNLTLATPVPSSNPFSGVVEAMRNGCLMYKKWCRQCHGEMADGQGVRWSVGAKNLRKYQLGLSQFVAIVVAGRPKKQMPPWGGVLNGEEIMQIGAYLETLAVEGANWKDR